MQRPLPLGNEAKDAEEILGLLFLADLATLVQLKEQIYRHTKMASSKKMSMGG